MINNKKFLCNSKYQLRKFKGQNEILCVWLMPNAGTGLWLMFLLPLCLIISTGKHTIISSGTYKLSSIFSFGLICTNILFIYYGKKNKLLEVFNFKLIISMLFTSFLFFICLHTGIPFSLWSGIFSTLIYYKLYTIILKNLPKSFTYGEAAICCQGFTLFLYFAINNTIIYLQLDKTPHGVMQIATCTIQQGLLAVTTIFLLSYKFSIKNPIKFYITAVTIIIFYIFIVLYILIEKNPLLWVFDQILDDVLQRKIIIFWIIFSSCAVVIIRKQILAAQKASTAVRKTFHILSVAVFVPGLLYNCSFLYLASGVVLGIFFILELLRILDIPPLAQPLQNGMVVFVDEKDAGIIALTPIYLLVGCSLPMWIHPSPCDITNSAGFNLLPLLSGILIIGIGDTAASFFGSKFGRHYWTGTKKTIEGTFSCILFQVLFIALLIYFDYLKIREVDQYVKTGAAIIISSLIEAKTDQVDNLVLPLVSYLILI